MKDRLTGNGVLRKIRPYLWGSVDDASAVHRTDLHSTACEDGRIFAGQLYRFVDIRRVQDIEPRNDDTSRAIRTVSSASCSDSARVVTRRERIRDVHTTTGDKGVVSARRTP